MAAAQPAVVAHLDANVVLRALRKEVLHEQPAARAERQRLHAVLLLHVVGDAIDDRVDRGRRAADRHAADRPRRRQIALHERLRHPEHAGDVVEAVAGVVGLQEVVDVDVQRQQVAHGVAVLGAVEAMERLRAPGIGRRRPGGVQLRLQPRRDAVVLGLVRARPADRRHHGPAQLAHDLLPHVGMAAHVGGIEAVERQPGRPDALVVTGDAVAGEQRVRRRAGTGRGQRAAARRPPPRRAQPDRPAARRQVQGIGAGTPRFYPTASRRTAGRRGPRHSPARPSAAPPPTAAQGAHSAPRRERAVS